MKKFINQAESFIPEMLEGIYLAHPDRFRFVNDDLHCLTTARPVSGKVGIITGGGSGHLPLFLGYVGEGMLDGCAIGDVFQSPSPEQILAVTQAADSGAGVLYIYGNYNGDIFNFDMAAEMADMESDIRTCTVVVADDSAGAVTGDGSPARRGVAGLFFVYKCAGASAARMNDLETVQRIARKAGDRVRTLGVALSPCIVPRIGKPGFCIGDREMEIGMGLHGERGIRRGPQLNAEKIAEEMMSWLLADSPCQQEDEVAVLINGLGATPLEELYLMYRHVQQILAKSHIRVFRVWVGEFATAMEMTGMSISLMPVDDELKTLLNAGADTPMYRQFPA
ncbi:dihydroxyacetone kinase subunit DhaK [Salmonella enterica]|uniref:Dihydroxyacetone kinase subunit DhaK n=2 Tax=Salmonella enterica TaxID=28901 RepID=A0A5V3YJB6_SALER|nr:dihydroxyacetone kinase subunit DhaK [Salmonella enterica]EBR8572927.1 dihydroxyacetone kinase [Salmonella enterica subsp. enterica serovar Java]EBW7308908.1 dihydroxyacetone kinase [Salmonella enterica subsp. enterica serovar Enteritidis]EBW9700575.1 dihydroxyacetone kinase [Salmonella enterica subsp. enterica serovar Oranienburg]EKN5803831.1 dihydroxyacetone kinase subunit DhaK [Salmonella enterica subsp. enterica]